MAPALAAAITGVLAFLLYAVTAARTITWWDGSMYPLAAATLGVVPAPGSLILTLLGGLVALLPGIEPLAFRFNLLAALIGAATAAGIAWLGATLAKPADRPSGGLEILAGVFAGMTFALALTPWTYAVQFTPYGLTALFSLLILVAVLSWWDVADGPDGPVRLGLVFLLIGLDVSVHRTNLLLVPGILACIALRRPAAPRMASAVASVFGLAAGLAVHLVLIPLAARGPALNLGDPSNLARFWSYVMLEDRGGGLLVDVWPRRADFLRVQLGDLTRFLRDNLWPMASAWAALAPAALLGLGALLTIRRDGRRGLAMLALFLSAGLGAVIYFNRPESYFRSLDRHYLPALVVIAPLLAVGARGFLDGVLRIPETGRALLLSAAAVILIIPVTFQQIHAAACNLSKIRFAETLSRDVLESLPPGAVLLTNGDNDTIPLWYLQQAEQVRTDVTVLNLPLARTPAFLEALGRRDTTFADLLADARGPGVFRSDSTVAIPVDSRAAAGLPASFTPPDTLFLRPPYPRTPEAGPTPDDVAIALLRRFGWRRPLHLALTVAPETLGWLRPYARLDGLSLRIVPTLDPRVLDLEGARRRLLEQPSHAGIADPKIPMDDDSRAMCTNIAGALLQLAEKQIEAGDPEAALATLEFQSARVPLSRLGVTAANDPAWRLRQRAEQARDARARDVSR